MEPGGVEVSHCCEDMRDQVDFRCADHPDAGGCGDYLIGFSPRFNEYGLWIHDGEGGSAFSTIVIRFCPFCGAALPDGRRDQWFDRLEALGVDPEAAPDAMLVYGWWND